MCGRLEATTSLDACGVGARVGSPCVVLTLEFCWQHLWCVARALTLQGEWCMCTRCMMYGIASGLSGMPFLAVYVLTWLGPKSVGVVDVVCQWYY